MSVNPDAVSRTAKIFTDSGEAATLEEAHALLDSFVLQVHIGEGLAGHHCRQAAALTVVNAASRAFKGGVRVLVQSDVVLEVGWYTGEPLSHVVQRLGGELIDATINGDPTICIGDVHDGVRGRPVLRATFDGWTGGVVEGTGSPLTERDLFVPAGVAAGGIAVAEAFEFRRGKHLMMGRRDQGLSLWRPEVPWMSADALGPDDVTFAPSQWWLVGLGHLGQGYLWTVGMLPYVTPSDVHLLLQDGDTISTANESTGLLLTRGLIGKRKTRVLADVLEQRGFRTTISERRLQPGDGPNGDEPRLALIGVDSPDTRLRLSDHGFDFVVDAGLGGGPVHYLDMQLHTFPAERRSDEIAGWQQMRTLDTSLLDLPAYQHMTHLDGDQCGTIEVAGRSVAASFVGATAGALVVAEAIRSLRGDHRYSVIDGSLRDLRRVGAVQITDAPPIPNTGYAALR